MKIMGNDGASEKDEANQSESEQQQPNAADAEAGQSSDAAAEAGAAGGSTVNKQGMQRKLSSGLGALDSLLAKTENAQHAMARQNKQMKSFLP